MPSFPTSSSKSFSSTPVKNISGKDLHRSKSLNNDSSDNDSTYSLLSPIYHDSFVSDEHYGADAPPRQIDTSATQSEDARSISPTRCELPQRLSDKTVAERDQAGASLSAWEMWLVCKAKDDRLKMEQKAEEERILMERKQKEENEQLEKNTIVEEKIQQWLKMKKEQEKQEKHLKESQEEEQIQRQQHKKREAKMIAEKKYKEWLIKKTQEKIEREKRETEEKAKKEAQEGERRQRAEDKFRQWLASTQDKAKPSPRSQCCPRDGYSNISYPLPSYYNPIPWKPVNIPPPEKTTKKNTSGNKQQCQKNYQQSPSVPFRLRNTVSAGNLLQKR